MAGAKKKKPDFEASLAELEQIVDRLEDGELPLEDALKQWEHGMKLKQQCQKILAGAEQKVEILLDNDGEPEPFKADD